MQVRIIHLLLCLFVITSIIVPNKRTLAGNKDNSKITVVVIDPGHGGKDPGASIGTAKEKDIVLAIAKKLGTTIKQNYPNIKVVYTRQSDVFIPLHKRADIANKNEADLFISLHVNAVDAKSVKGTETFVLGLHRNQENLEVAQKENAAILLEDDYETTYEDFDPNSDESYIMFASMQEEYQNQSVLFASHIQEEFKQHAKRSDRSVKMAGFLVLRRTTMPSVLVETGFLSHTQERAYLTSKQGQNQLAQSIYRAFITYKNKIEEKSEFHIVNNTTSEPATSTNTPATPQQQPENTTKPDTAPKAQSEQATPVKKEIKKGVPHIYYSVQIIALKKNLDTTPENFKGETNIFKVPSPTINRYFSGKFETIEQAQAEKNRIQQNYASAFVVAFKNNELISVKMASELK